MATLPCASRQMRAAALDCESTPSQNPRLSARCMMMAKIVKETATLAQARSKGQWETRRSSNTRNRWARRLRTNSSPLLGQLCARKNARSLSARTGMRWCSRCCHSNCDAASCCHPVQNHPGSTSSMFVGRGRNPHQINPRRNLETSQASELICRTCYSIEVVDAVAGHFAHDCGIHCSVSLGNHAQCFSPTGPTGRNCGSNCIAKSHPTKNQRQRSHVLRTSRARISWDVKLFRQLRRHHSNEIICPRCSAMDQESPTQLHLRNQRYAVEQHLVVFAHVLQLVLDKISRGVPKILIPCSAVPASSPPLQTLARSTNWARLSKKSHTSGLMPARFHTFVFPQSAFSSNM